MTSSRRHASRSIEVPRVPAGAAERLRDCLPDVGEDRAQRAVDALVERAAERLEELAGPHRRSSVRPAP